MSPIRPAPPTFPAASTPSGVTHAHESVPFPSPLAGPREGRLGDCAPLPGELDGFGFSEAAVKIASSMRMTRWTQAGGPVDGVIDLPIRFNLSSGAFADTPAPPAPK